MNLVVDTGVFSASLYRGARRRYETQLRLMSGHQVHLAVVSVAELRYGALVAGWGERRRQELEDRIAASTVVPVSGNLLSEVARLRYECRRAAHPLHDRSHANDLWIAASAIHISAPLLTADSVFDGTPGLQLLR